MPQLSEITGKRDKKKFVKRSYRPWDLSGDSGNNSLNQTIVPNEKVEEKADYQTQPIEIDENVPANKGNIIDNVKPTLIQHNENNKLTHIQQLGNTNTTINEHTADILDNDKDNTQSLIEDVRNLTGIQERIFNYLLDVCAARGVSDSGHLRTSDLALVANCSIGSVKTSLERLVYKKLIIRKKGKRSKGGYISLYIDKEIQAAASQAKMFVPQILAYANFNKNNLSLDNTMVNNLVNNNSLSSSSLNIIKTTTTDLPNDWKNINCNPLKEFNFGLTEIFNIFKKCPESITSSIVQESIYHFCWGLQNNPDRYKNMKAKSAVLVANLIQGKPWNEELYVSEEDKIKAEKHKRLVNQIEKNFKLSKFNEWFNTLTDSQKENLVSESLRQSTSYKFSKNKMEQEQGQMLFDKKIWPELLDSLILDFST